MNSGRMMWLTTIFDILSDDTEFVYNNMGSQAYRTVGSDRAVLSGIMQIVTSAVHILRILGLF